MRAHDDADECSFTLPEDYEKPDFRLGLPVYNRRRIIAYSQVPNAENYRPRVINGELCGWIGPLVEHHCSHAQQYLC